MRVLVTGSTGYIGAWTTRELVARGHSVRVLVRTTSDLTPLDDLDVDLCTGDLMDAESVSAAAEGCEVVVHAGGIARLRHRDRDRLFAVNRDGTERVMEAAKQAGVRRVIYLSSAGAMGGSMTPVAMDESWVTTVADVGVDYFESKWAGEQVATGFRDAMSVCVVRPGIVLGPGDALGSSAGTILRMARGTLPATVRGGGSYCDVRDVACALAEIVESEDVGETYLLGGHNVEMAEMARLVSERSGVRAPRHVPYLLMIVVAWLFEVWAWLGGKRAAVSRQLVRGARRYTFMDSGKAERDLGYKNRALESSLDDTLRWFIAHGDLRPDTPELRSLEI